ncbi:MAG: hypothetical protein LDL41_03855 [Coleofasciculus sp. S288]|nr:hypothetical protein [Coleofasciculus sp. S288]
MSQWQLWSNHSTVAPDQPLVDTISTEIAINPYLMVSPVEKLTNPAPRIQTFLDLVDRVTEMRGVNVPPVD